LTSSPTLFDEVVDASGLAQVIAPFAISRLLVSAGVLPPQDVTPEGLRDALPALEEGLAAYLRDEALEQAVTRVRALAT
jgi:hypothetical protein